MGKQWARQELKRNTLAETIEKVIQWAQAHKEATVGVGLTFFAAIIIILYFISQYLALRTRAWEKLAVAQSYAFSGKLQDSLGQIRSLTTELPQTKAAGYALLFEGDLLYRQGLYKEAIQAYQRFLEIKNPKTLIPFALAGLGAAQEAYRNYQEAISTDRKFLEEYGDHFLAPQVHLSLARCLETTSKEEARSTYERIGFLYPETVWSQMAVQKLQSSLPPDKKP